MSEQYNLVFDSKLPQTLEERTRTILISNGPIPRIGEKVYLARPEKDNLVLRSKYKDSRKFIAEMSKAKMWDKSYTVKGVYYDVSITLSPEGLVTTGRNDAVFVQLTPHLPKRNKSQ